MKPLKELVIAHQIYHHTSKEPFLFHQLLNLRLGIKISLDY